MTDERRTGHHDEEQPDARFLTDQDPEADAIEPEAGVLDAEPASAAVILPPTDLSVLDERPAPGRPRDYQFPAFTRTLLGNGLTVMACHMPGRRLLAASLVFPGGGASEPAHQAGVSVLAARALTEGTRRRSAVEFIEAGERLGAEIHADTSWDATVATLEVPRSRFGPALALLAEMVLEADYPAHEVDRLREERLNDLLQLRADARRRAERVFTETIYSSGSSYGRPLAGSEVTVPGLSRDQVLARHRDLLGGGGATLVVAGDLDGLSVAGLAEEHLGGWSISLPEPPPPPGIAPHPAGPRLVLVDKPGAPQSELRLGHVGLARRTEDFHAVSVMNALLGGKFDSRLTRLLREERGYTYHITSSFEMRRAAGPFAVRAAVQTEVTAPALVDIIGVLRGLREEAVESRELEGTRDYLVGIFPLRFEAPEQVCAALAGLVVQQLPDDELDRYRPAIASVEAGAVLEAARRHVRPDEASIVIVGDAEKIEAPLRDADLPRIEVVAGGEDEVPA